MNAPVVKTQMLIRKPVEDVFEGVCQSCDHKKVLVHEEHWEIGSRQARSLGLGNVWRVRRSRCQSN